MKHNINCIHYCKLDGTCLKIKGNFLGFKYTKSCDWHPLYNFKCREPFERPPLLLQAKDYNKNMQSRISKKEFEPFTLNIEINTIDEAKSLWNIFNLNHTPLLYEVMGKDYYNVELENRIKSSKYQEQLDNVLKDLGEEPDVKP